MNEDYGKEALMSSKQKRSYYNALTKIFSYQNKDGSWGSKHKDQVTLTSQAIQLMHTLNVGHETPALKNATRWLEDHVKRGDLHWTTRLEVGLKIGEYEKLVNEKYIDAFITDLEYDLSHPDEDDRLDFFWDVIPTVIALYPYEERYKKKSKKSVPHDKLIERAMRYCEYFGDNQITVLNQANHTGLVALYFAIISDSEKYKLCKNNSNAMINWLFASRMESKEEGSIFWQHSKGITSYVLIDLLGCNSNNIDIRNFIPKILKYLTPDNKGNVKRDDITTYDTELHGDPLYVTMVILRAMAEVVARYDCDEFLDFQLAVQKPSWIKKNLWKLSCFFQYHKGKIPLVMSAFLSVSAIYLLVKGQIDFGFFALSIGVSGAISMLYDWLRN